MIYVTQGHELGVGLEVFVKSAMLLNNESLKNITLLCSENSLKKTLDSLGFHYKFSKSQVEIAGIKINYLLIPKNKKSESLNSLQMGIDLCEKTPNSILFTLPTSKDQLDGHAGHTEYFRDFYKSPDLPMYFYGPDFQVLLLSDHLAVKDLSQHLKSNRIEKKLTITLDALKKWKIPHQRILISGFNPHAGENGILGTEESELKKILPSLQKRFKDLVFEAPIPADTMIFSHKDHTDLLVYWFHDQGLGIFKAHHELIGANITLGLPYLRVSVDHGTAFNLYGKNQADERGCYYVLNLAQKFLSRIQNRG